MRIYAVLKLSGLIAGGGKLEPSRLDESEYLINLMKPKLKT